MKPEHEAWVRLHPVTLAQLLSYVEGITDWLPIIHAEGIEVGQLIVSTPDHPPSMVKAIRDWAEKTAKQLEPLIKEDRKKSLCTPWADLHVMTDGADDWLERYAANRPAD